MFSRSLICAAAMLAIAAVPVPVRAQLAPDQMTSYKLGAPAPHWAYIFDSPSSVPQVSKVLIVDTDARKLLGQLNGGYLASFVMSPDRSELYMAGTFYSRTWHGTRTDAVEIFDARTLDFKSEIKIPPKRLLIVPKDNSAAVTTDGRFMIVANLTPATSVSVVDLKAHKFVGEIETPGCVQVMVSGARKFSSMCADGSILTVTLDDAGKLAHRGRSKPFFNPSKDPVFDQPAVVGATAYFDSYHGMIYKVDLSGEVAVAEPGWSALDDADRKANWRPGGWQSISASADGAEIYLLMHQGGEWTHKQFGKEVWVLNAAQKNRTARIALKTQAYSIRASAGPQPILECLALLESQLETYSLPDGKYLGVYRNLGAPFLIYGP
ncbi:MAG TPA: amine dehydrogenase large subunit [Candidatus Binataceae bacterium]|nr:amine dehydrogenase large subunit [Candidatus Binataceae bacterium]